MEATLTTSPRNKSKALDGPKLKILRHLIFEFGAGALAHFLDFGSSAPSISLILVLEA